MGIFTKNYYKMLEKLGEQEKAELTNGWEYVLMGYCVVDRSKLEKTVELGNLLADMCQYYAMSPLVDEAFAYDTAVKYGLPAFYNHKGKGYTVQEYFSLVSKQLQGLAGYSSRELAEVEKVEKSIDALGIAPTGATKNLPVSHTNEPSKKAPYDEKIATPIMIGDALNILGYHANKIGDSKNSKLDDYFEATIYTLAKEGNLTDAEIDRVINGAKAGQKEISKVKR